MDLPRVVKSGNSFMGGEINACCMMFSSTGYSSVVSTNLRPVKNGLPLGGVEPMMVGGVISFGPPEGITGWAQR